MDEIGSGITSTSLQLDFEGWSDGPRTRVNPARVRLLAQALGYTLVHISKSLQTSRTSVNKWISGLSQPTQFLEGICNLFTVTSGAWRMTFRRLRPSDRSSVDPSFLDTKKSGLKRLLTLAWWLMLRPTSRSGSG